MFSQTTYYTFFDHNPFSELKENLINRYPNTPWSKLSKTYFGMHPRILAIYENLFENRKAEGYEKKGTKKTGLVIFIRNIELFFQFYVNEQDSLHDKIEKNIKELIQWKNEIIELYNITSKEQEIVMRRSSSQWPKAFPYQIPEPPFKENYIILKKNDIATFTPNEFAFNEPAFSEPAFDESAFSESAFSESFSESAFSESVFSESVFSEPAFDESTFNKPPEHGSDTFYAYKDIANSMINYLQFYDNLFTKEEAISKYMDCSQAQWDYSIIILEMLCQSPSQFTSISENGALANELWIADFFRKIKKLCESDLLHNLTDVDFLLKAINKLLREIEMINSQKNPPPLNLEALHTIENENNIFTYGNLLMEIFDYLTEKNRREKKTTAPDEIAKAYFDLSYQSLALNKIKLNFLENMIDGSYKWRRNERKYFFNFIVNLRFFLKNIKEDNPDMQHKIQLLKKGVDKFKEKYQKKNRLFGKIYYFLGTPRNQI